MTGKDKIRENTGEKGSNSTSELGKVFSETPLTTEQKVDELGKEMKNVDAGVGELLNLFKNVHKKQEETENIIEKQIAENNENAGNIGKQIENIYQQINNMTQQINTLMLNKNKIFHDIFSGKDAGEVEIIENTPANKYVQKGGHFEFFINANDKYRPETFHNIGYNDILDIQTAILYCLKVALALHSRGIIIEDKEQLDREGNEIFFTYQGFSWTIDEIKKGINIYCYREDNDIKDILKYIIYLYHGYAKE